MAGTPPVPENGVVPLRALALAHCVFGFVLIGALGIMFGAGGILAFMSGTLALTLGILALYYLGTVRTIEVRF